MRYLAANPAYAEIVGVPLEQIVGRPMIEVMGAEALQKISQYVDRVMRGQRVEYEALLPYNPALAMFMWCGHPTPMAPIRLSAGSPP